jgi:hypothetical protein
MMNNNYELVSKFNSLVFEEAGEANKQFQDKNAMTYAYAYGTLMGSIYHFAHLPGFEDTIQNLITMVEERLKNPQQN